MGNWKDPEVVALWIWGGLALVCVLAIGIIVLIRNYGKSIRKEEQKRSALVLRTQKELFTHGILVQEEERSRIAADLHDNLVSRLQVIRLSNNLGEDKETINTHLQESMQVARRISHDLSPPFLHESKISLLLYDYLQALKNSYKIQFHANKHQEDFIEDPVKLQVLRIFQEVMNNCIKHANASEIKVLLRTGKSYLSLYVEDNGIGADFEKSKGMGVKNIETRSQLLKATYRFRSKPFEGTQFLLVIPFSNLLKS